jgi:hypothetical protein
MIGTLSFHTGFWKCVGSYDWQKYSIFESWLLAECRTLSSMIFDFGSKMSCIKIHVFLNCSSLSSNCIPSFVKKLRSGCFYGCRFLSTNALESDTILRVFKVGRF